MVLDGTQTYEGSTLTSNVYEFGSQNDVATATSYAQNTVVLKIEGNLTITEGITLTSVKSTRTAMVDQKECLYIAHGTLTNNGTISMTARGAKAVGQNVYLFKNIDDSFEYVPAVGGNGGARTVIGTSIRVGNSGTNGFNRSTGGGAGGSASMTSRW